MSKVLKRDGNIENFNTAKVKNVIEWACEGLSVTPLMLESRVDELQKEVITTREIHDSLIYQAQTLATAKESDWVYVAGRLNTMKRWKDTGAYDVEFKVFVNDMITSGKYSHENIFKYTDEDLDYLDTVLDQELDLQHSYGSTLTAEKKYLLEGECIQQLFMVEAMIIFAEKGLDKVVELYHALSNRKISLASPWLSNLRSGGNISSCFIISVGDSTSSITDSWAKAADISRMGGGLGIYMGNLRAEGSKIDGRPNSSKSINVGAKVYNDIAVYFDQGGKRAGAFTLALPIWHNDIDDFLELQSETGDQRKKAHDVFPQVCIPDLFMEKDLSDDKTWYTFCPYELKQHGINMEGAYGEVFNALYNKAVELADAGVLEVFSIHNTRDLLKHIMRTQFESGLPYIAFTDEINRQNPNKHMGTIPCGNLCQESFSVLDYDNYSHTCNLASVVAGRMESYDEIVYYSGLLTEVLDSGIGLTNPPHQTSKDHNETFRTIGIGIQGMHDWLVKKNTNYNNLEELTRFAEHIEYGSIKKSCELAQELGSYPAFDGSDWSTGARFESFIKDSVSDLDWEALKGDVMLLGIRNSQLTSPAPNTSTSVFMDAAAGVMPVYSAFFREDNDNGKYPVASMFLNENPIGYGRSFRHYDQSDLTASVGALQKFVDTGISAEYLFDQNKENFKAKDLYDMIHSAWKNKTKTIYYIRSIKKGETVDDLLGIKGEGCVGCEG